MNTMHKSMLLFIFSIKRATRKQQYQNPIKAKGTTRIITSLTMKIIMQIIMVLACVLNTGFGLVLLDTLTNTLQQVLGGSSVTATTLPSVTTASSTTEAPTTVAA
ncbi:hypothetical protein O3G_MSEX010929 [Manduca sexta]|uniref:Uncharacterized protein n=1 Tax=Manduca sexta TaxID=7130 RepID=A0A921ZKX0_MANSE|nr:hypothetical protein O3G_MSEX010929 [Manduca sexta]